MEGARTGSLGLNSLFEGKVFPSCPLEANAPAPDCGWAAVFVLAEMDGWYPALSEKSLCDAPTPEKHQVPCPELKTRTAYLVKWGQKGNRKERVVFNMGGCCRWSGQREIFFKLRSEKEGTNLSKPGRRENRLFGKRNRDPLLV